MKRTINIRSVVLLCKFILIENMINKKDLTKLILFIIFLLLIIIFFKQINYYFDNAQNIVTNSGIFAPLFYMVLISVAVIVIPIPASPLAIISGIIFGPWLGMLYTLIGATFGALVAFLIARFFFQDFIKRKFSNNRLYQKIMKSDNKRVISFIFFTRLMPQISFDLVSYISGLTRINIFVFAIVTFLGMIPIVFLETFFGYLIRPYLVIFLIIMLLVFIGYVVYHLIKGKRDNNN